MQGEFLKKFFPNHKTNALKRQIQNFSQNPNEAYFQCWERFKDLLNSCPHHGFEKWHTISFFYEGLTPETKQFVETMCNGEFLDKEPEEALEYLDHLAENSQSWHSTSSSENSIRSNLANASRGKHHLNQEDDLNARVASLTRKIEAMEMKKEKEIKSVQNDEICGICDAVGHSTNICPNIPVFKEVFHEQVNVMNNYKKPFPSSFSDTYNPGWRNHPNFSWRRDNDAQQIPSQGSANFPTYAQSRFKNLEETLQAFMQRQTNINNQTSQALTDIRNTLSALTESLRIQEKGKFPAQPKPNPSNHCQVSSSSQNPPENVNSITTLRSGKVIDKTIPSKDPMPNVPQEPVPNVPHEPESDGKNDGKKDKGKIDEPVVNKCPFPAPFPQRLGPVKTLNNNSEIFEVLKQVKVNIPLLDAIKQIPSYAKFLKDLCTVKRKLNVQKKAFLTENVSSIIQQNTPSKYKDPGCPTITCVIGNTKVERALLDLGASVNLLPFSVYKQLGLGELKPTPVTLQLADRSTKVPRGVVEDVLVQIDKFYYPIDFIILDTQSVSNPNAQIPVILGRPFLATSNALINCRNGVLKLSFGNMTLELNVFNICKQPMDNNDVHEVDFIDELVHDKSISTVSTNPLEVCLTTFDEHELNNNSEISHVFSLNSFQEAKMDHLSNIRELLPVLSDKILKKIYCRRIETLRVFMHRGIPEDIRMIIEAKVRMESEYPWVITRHLAGSGKSNYAKKRRAKKMGVCHKCARWTCNKRCRSVGFTSINREDKISYIKDGLSRETLDGYVVSLDAHPSGDVQHQIQNLWNRTKNEREKYSLGNLTLKDPVCWFIRKLDGKHIPDS
ncbi:hypothetical protein PTKIN_Ptkin12aG0116600 [Pterospermum kingtungense]